MIAEDGSIQKRIIMLLNDMGIDINGYRFDSEDQQFYIKRVIRGKDYELPFGMESDGTKKLIAALPMILLALSEGRLVIVDELDAKLHPKLLRYIISLFKNPEINTRGAQLVFTSHDMKNMQARSIRSMRFGGKTANALTILLRMISSIWRGDMGQIPIYRIC